MEWFDILESKVKKLFPKISDPDICEQLEQAFTIARSESQVPTRAVTDIKPDQVVKMFGLRVDQNSDAV